MNINELRSVGILVGEGVEAIFRSMPWRIPSGASVKNTAGKVAGAAGRGALAAGDAAIGYGKRFGAWAGGPGKHYAQAFGGWAGTPSIGRHAAAGLTAGTIGYATSTSDDPGQRLGRAAGFALGGVYASNRVFSNEGIAAMGRMAKNVELGPKLAPRFMAANARTAFGLPAKWTPLHSAAAGAFYGMTSDQETITGGITGGVMLDVAGRSLYRQGRNAAGAISNLRTGEGGRLAAFRSLPLMRGGAALGMGLGAYNAMGQNAGALGIMGAGILGGMKAGATGGAVWAGTGYPATSLSLGLGGLGIAAPAVEGTRQIAQAGAPGMTPLEADGDLALALHRMRHS